VIVLLNLFLIVLTMIPSFREHVLPKIPAKLGKAYYALATTHAALGTITEVAGLYILLAAGTSVLPQKFRITNLQALDANGWDWQHTPVGTFQICSQNESRHKIRGHLMNVRWTPAASADLANIANYLFPSLPYRMAAMMRGLRRPWSIARMTSGFSSGA
jgi:hypothetical protein